MTKIKSLFLAGLGVASVQGCGAGTLAPNAVQFTQRDAAGISNKTVYVNPTGTGLFGFTASGSLIPVTTGTGLVITGSVLSALSPDPYVLPVASSTVLGGVKVGEGLSITNGILWVSSTLEPVPSSFPVIGDGVSLENDSEGTLEFLASSDLFTQVGSGSTLAVSDMSPSGISQRLVVSGSSVSGVYLNPTYASLVSTGSTLIKSPSGVLIEGNSVYVSGKFGYDYHSDYYDVYMSPAVDIYGPGFQIREWSGARFLMGGPRPGLWGHGLGYMEGPGGISGFSGFSTELSRQMHGNVTAYPIPEGVRFFSAFNLSNEGQISGETGMLLFPGYGMRLVTSGTNDFVFARLDGDSFELEVAEIPFRVLSSTRATLGSGTIAYLSDIFSGFPINGNGVSVTNSSSGALAFNADNVTITSDNYLIRPYSTDGVEFTTPYSALPATYSAVKLLPSTVSLVSGEASLNLTNNLLGEIQLKRVSDMPGPNTGLGIIGVRSNTNALSAVNLTQLQDGLTSKQDKLIAGSNITITSNTISATGGGSSGFPITGNGITMTNPSANYLQISSSTGVRPGRLQLNSDYIVLGFVGDSSTPMTYERINSDNITFNASNYFRFNNPSTSNYVDLKPISTSRATLAGGTIAYLSDISGGGGGGVQGYVRISPSYDMPYPDIVNAAANTWYTVTPADQDVSNYEVGFNASVEGETTFTVSHVSSSQPGWVYVMNPIAGDYYDVPAGRTITFDFRPTYGEMDYTNQTDRFPLNGNGVMINNNSYGRVQMNAPYGTFVDSISGTKNTFGVADRETVIQGYPLSIKHNANDAANFYLDAGGTNTVVGRTNGTLNLQGQQVLVNGNPIGGGGGSLAVVNLDVRSNGGVEFNLGDNTWNVVTNASGFEPGVVTIHLPGDEFTSSFSVVVNAALDFTGPVEVYDVYQNYCGTLYYGEACYYYYEMSYPTTYTWPFNPGLASASSSPFPITGNNVAIENPGPDWISMHNNTDMTKVEIDEGYLNTYSWNNTNFHTDGELKLNSSAGITSEWGVNFNMNGGQIKDIGDGSQVTDAVNLDQVAGQGIPFRFTDVGGVTRKRLSTTSLSCSNPGVYSLASTSATTFYVTFTVNAEGVYVITVFTSNSTATKTLIMQGPTVHTPSNAITLPAGRAAHQIICTISNNPLGDGKQYGVYSLLP